MKDSCCVPTLRVRATPSFKRRARVLFRIALRRLFRTELVATDSRGNPKSNPIRWMV
jgi:hypothetical protein